MAKRDDDARAGRGRGADDDEPRAVPVDVPTWVLGFVCVVVAVGFLIAAIRGHVDPEMYGLVALVLGGGKLFAKYRGRNLS